MKGAGGTSGGVGQFFIGLIMLCGGLYMLFNSIVVSSSFGMGMRLYGFNAFGGHWGITSGIVMIPFMFGVGLIFFSAKNILGWILTIGSLTALVFGVISSIHFSMRSMTAFELIVILVLAVGGLGLFLRSLRNLGGD
ncbi:conserved hypothetical protein [Hahella chejuensis KCTC 2396]|uniref:Uncharacterized protein n=1 Tax=Hahella chejuensis (strain KCTC 2396) TaxID=349521 RepID=Q2SIZ5_HAHCH|nr:hypothetical protein [Hahella chejuensis]ABC29379.1 conserved hypothetical protein [Hahella chejuensis KCTC 2396]